MEKIVKGNRDQKRDVRFFKICSLISEGYIRKFENEKLVALLKVETCRLPASKRTHVRFEGRAGCQRLLRERMFACARLMADNQNVRKK